MPRDLLADKKTLDEMPHLSRDPTSPELSDEPVRMPMNTQLVRVEDRFKKMDTIHPFSSLLSYDDLDDCDWLEHVAFDAIEAATREKVYIISYPINERLHQTTPE